ncbi:bifunctional hydroxymethylpyrimidine kinase/phosphomethylpyrimidine kinase [bacterium]|nr:bifunctional hydroxymethylpyrimidine kinase/phosphomethylpyrimidine kinase [bacterium]
MLPVALTIAGSDPSGGAGLQADLKTFHQLGVYGMSVVTLLTVQNTQRVDEVDVLMPEFVQAELDAVLEDIPPQAAKTGALGDASVIEAVAQRAGKFGFPLVVDPVMISKHGAELLPAEAVAVLRERLLPRAFLVTPNMREAGLLAGFAVENVAAMERAADAIGRLGPANVLVKGGALLGEAIDVLWTGGRVRRVTSEHIPTRQTHGSGCVYSAAITAYLASGMELVAAVEQAKAFISEAIRTAPGLGKGLGPLNLHAKA